MDIDERQIKEHAIARLTHLSWDIIPADADRRLLTYVQNCTDLPEYHNLYELLSVVRFHAILSKYTLDTKELNRFIKCYELLKFPTDRGRKSYKLTPVQVFQFANLLAIKTNDGLRLCREALLFLPRKFSKTSQLAGLAIYFLLFDDHDGQIFCAANSFKQANTLYTIIKDLLKGIDPELKAFKTNRDQCWNNKTGAYIRCLSSNADKLDSLNPSLIILDEYSNADNADVKNTLQSGQVARKQPLTVVISTNSSKADTPFQDMLKSYKSILRGELDNDRVFAHLFMMDEGDREDDPIVWQKVNPHIGTAITMEAYHEAYDRAKLTADAMTEFRIKQLNINADKNSQTAWITRANVDMATIDYNIRVKRPNVQCMIGIDLSVDNDLTAVTFLQRDPVERMFYCHTEYFCTEKHLTDHPKKYLFQKWSEQGFINVCKGDLIDYIDIYNKINELSAFTPIQFIGYDSFKSKELINMIIAAGGSKIVKPIKQTQANFTAPCMAMERAVKLGQFKFSNNPINQWIYTNAVLVTDNMGNCKPFKRSANEKIDGVISALMALRLYLDV